MEERVVVDEHGHIEDDMPAGPPRATPQLHGGSVAAEPAEQRRAIGVAAPSGSGDQGAAGERYESGDEDLELDGVDDPDGVLGALFERLQNVVSALNETELENEAMQDEIKQLLADQEEQEELRDELSEQLKQRGELVAKIAQQTLADNESSSDIVERMARLRAESEREKSSFRMEMSRLDDELSKLTDGEGPQRVGGGKE